LGGGKRRQQREQDEGGAEESGELHTAGKMNPSLAQELRR
jgi:hypothetical protein